MLAPVATLSPSVQNLQSGLTAFKDAAIPFIVTISSIGLCSMAIVQTIKDQTPLRQWYQRRRVGQWLQEGVATVNTKLPAGMPAVDWHTVETDMLRMATDGEPKAFYALEIEKLCGQLNAAAQSAMQDVATHRAFVAFLASEADTSCLNIVLGGIPSDANGPLPQTDPKMQAYAAARGQVAQQVQRAIDALQLSVGADWQTRMQQVSLVLSVVIAIAAIGIFAKDAPSDFWGSIAYAFSLQRFLLACFIGLLGGYIAPVAKDLIAALQKLGE